MSPIHDYVAEHGAIYSAGLVFCAALVFTVWRQHQFKIRGGFPLPPGPPGLPLFGNTLELNSINPWLSYEQWGKKYGPLIYIKLLGKDFIIINSVKVAHDLFDKRSTIYSDRPYLPTNEMFGMDFNSGLLPYGDKWRLHRKMLNMAFNKESVSQYRPIALRKARQLVENFLDTPRDFEQHCKTFAAAAIMAVTYGYEMAPTNDPFVVKLERFISLFLTALSPERAALFLAFPFLAHIPSWLPGGEHKLHAAECRALAAEVLTKPVEYVVNGMAAGTAGQSLVHDLLETQDGAMEEDIRAVAASTYLGGAETTDSSLRMFILAMVLYPDVQTKAWEEIDRVLGGERLPDFDDRPNLPYVEAVYLEVRRWRPTVPYGLPHMTSTSDVYEGMYIPKGAIVIANIWAMGHDETLFSNPMDFDPERHLTPARTLVEGTTTPNFGFGRRVCPGRYIADQNSWISIATVLATMRITKARDELGNEIDVKLEFTGGLSTAPKPFKCSITPRSSSIENLIRTKNEARH